MFVTIDPGADTGWAIWSNTKLVACGLGDPRSSTKHVASNVTDVWIESQVVYPHSPVPPNDIVKLAQDAGKWAGIYGTLAVNVHWLEPATWKGQLSKRVHHPRIWSHLSPLEQDILSQAWRGTAPSKRHNLMDAVGLGQFVLRNFWKSP